MSMISLYRWQRR